MPPLASPRSQLADNRSWDFLVSIIIGSSPSVYISYWFCLSEEPLVMLCVWLDMIRTILYEESENRENFN
jgi:hypothetical protein